MKLTSPNFINGTAIPAQFAFCRPAASGHISMSDNHTPALRWEEVPALTRSFVLTVVDPDAPSSADDVNQEGRSVAADSPRADFTHWVLIDLPATLRSIDAGTFSSGITPRGKSGPGTLHHARHGINDYTAWFANDAEMSGTYHGYDGPCPPWNDERVHRYIFTLYALDIEHCMVSDPFHIGDVRKAIAGHILAEASLTGTYTLNPALLR